MASWGDLRLIGGHGGHAARPDDATANVYRGKVTAINTGEPWMSIKISPIVSEFETQEQAAEYDAWFRKKVRASLAKPGVGVAHEDVMAQVDAVIREAERKAQQNS